MIECPHKHNLHIISLRVYGSNHILAHLRGSIYISRTQHGILAYRCLILQNMSVFLAGANQKHPRLIVQLPDCIHQIHTSLDIHIYSERRLLPRHTHRALCSQMIYIVRSDREQQLNYVILIQNIKFINPLPKKQQFILCLCTWKLGCIYFHAKFILQAASQITPDKTTRTYNQCLFHINSASLLNYSKCLCVYRCS